MSRRSGYRYSPYGTPAASSSTPNLHGASPTSPYYDSTPPSPSSHGSRPRIPVRSFSGPGPHSRYESDDYDSDASSPRGLFGERGAFPAGPTDGRVEQARWEIQEALRTPLTGSSALFDPDDYPPPNSVPRTPRRQASHSRTTQSDGETQRQQNHKKSHLCDECDKGFSSTGHLTRHKRLHSGVKDYHCPVTNCWRAFSRKDNMMQHFKSHTNPTSRASMKITPEEAQDYLDQAPDYTRRGSFSERSNAIPGAHALQHAPYTPRVAKSSHGVAKPRRPSLSIAAVFRSPVSGSSQLPVRPGEIFAPHRASQPYVYGDPQIHDEPHTTRNSEPEVFDRVAEFDRMLPSARRIWDDDDGKEDGVRRQPAAQSSIARGPPAIADSVDAYRPDPLYASPTHASRSSYDSSSREFDLAYLPPGPGESAWTNPPGRRVRSDSHDSSSRRRPIYTTGYEIPSPIRARSGSTGSFESLIERYGEVSLDAGAAARTLLPSSRETAQPFATNQSPPQSTFPSPPLQAFRSLPPSSPRSSVASPSPVPLSPQSPNTQYSPETYPASIPPLSSLSTQSHDDSPTLAPLHSPSPLLTSTHPPPNSPSPTIPFADSLAWSTSQSTLYHPSPAGLVQHAPPRTYAPPLTSSSLEAFDAAPRAWAPFEGRATYGWEPADGAEWAPGQIPGYGELNPPAEERPTE